MPEVYKRGEIWWYSFTIDGKRHRRSSKTSDKRLAEDIASKDEWRHRHAAVHGTEAVLTFGEALALYINTARDNRFLLPLLDRWENVKIRDITPDEIRRAAKAIYPGRSGATWNRQVITPARAVINAAADSGYCPHIRVKRFPEKVQTRRPGNQQWLASFQAACHAPKLAALARFMFETGARIGEAVSLEWNTVNLQEATATILKTKNGETHTVHLSPGLVAELANLDTERKVFGYASRHTVTPQWNKTIEKAGIEKLTPHEAGRHGFATELIVRHGIDIPTTAKMGNWKSHRLLSETYAHPERERETVLKVFGNKKRT
jgi:integrase